MTYRPVLSVVALLDFSINTGLLASTTTPGSTAPDGSRARPVSEAPACAKAVDANIVVSPKSNATLKEPRMSPPQRISPLPGGGRHTDAAYPAPIASRCPIHLRELVIQIWYRIRRHGLPPPASLHRCGRGIERHESRSPPPHLTAATEPPHPAARGGTGDHALRASSAGRQAHRRGRQPAREGEGAGRCGVRFL